MNSTMVSYSSHGLKNGCLESQNCWVSWISAQTISWQFRASWVCIVSFDLRVGLAKILRVSKLHVGKRCPELKGIPCQRRWTLVLNEPGGIGVWRSSNIEKQSKSQVRDINFLLSSSSLFLTWNRVHTLLPRQPNFAVARLLWNVIMWLFLLWWLLHKLTKGPQFDFIMWPFICEMRGVRMSASPCHRDCLSTMNRYRVTLQGNHVSKLGLSYCLVT